MWESSFTGPALVAGSLVGIREFNVEGDGNLVGPVYSDHPWTQGENEASCSTVGLAIQPLDPKAIEDLVRDYGERAVNAYLENRANGIKNHVVGNINCSCGFYAYFEGEPRDYESDLRVTGLIEGYGRVTVGSKGFRASHAKLLALIDPYQTVGASLWTRIKLMLFDNAELVATIGGVLFLACVGLSAAISLWFLLGALLGVTTFVAAFWAIESFDYKYVPRSFIDWQSIRKRYPEIPVFKSLADALKEFPSSRNVS